MKRAYVLIAILLLLSASLVSQLGCGGEDGRVDQILDRLDELDERVQSLEEGEAATPTPTPTPTPTLIPTQTPTPTPTPTLAPLEGVLDKDPALVQCFAWPYSDDADPDYDGTEIAFSFYDSKGDLIWLTNITVAVDVELNVAVYNERTGRWEVGRLVYQGSTTVSIGEDTPGGSMDMRLRIPYDSIAVDPDVDHPTGQGKIVVHTLEQGEFSCDLPVVKLY